MGAPIANADAPEQLDRILAAWAAQWPTTSLLGEVEHSTTPDERGHLRWLIRLKGEEKDVIAIWLTLRQRTVHLETQVMPAPEENLERLYRFLLTKNAQLRDLHLALGPEDGVYLVTTVPVGELDVERLDELVAASVTYVDEIFPTAMSMGLASLYRRRPSRPA